MRPGPNQIAAAVVAASAAGAGVAVEIAMVAAVVVAGATAGEKEPNGSRFLSRLRPTSAGLSPLGWDTCVADLGLRAFGTRGSGWQHRFFIPPSKPNQRPFDQVITECSNSRQGGQLRRH